MLLLLLSLLFVCGAHTHISSSSIFLLSLLLTCVSHLHITSFLAFLHTFFFFHSYLWVAHALTSFFYFRSYLCVALTFFLFSLICVCLSLSHTHKLQKQHLYYVFQKTNSWTSPLKPLISIYSRAIKEYLGLFISWAHMDNLLGMLPRKKEK